MPKKAKKMISVTNGTTDDYGFTRATTERGYEKAARDIWPYADASRVKFRVYDNLKIKKSGAIDGDIIFEGKL